MNTDTLIRALAADTAPNPRRMAMPGAMLAIGLLGATVAMVAALWAALGIRGDLVSSMGDAQSVLRFVLTGALALVAGRLVLVLARPEGRARFWPLAAVAAAALGLVIWTGLATPPQAWQMAVIGKTAVNCLISIPLLALAPVAVILASLRTGAPTAPELAGGVAGLCGGGLAAMVYALHCIEDSPLFYVTWYGLAIAAVSLASALVGARLLRW